MLALVGALGVVKRVLGTEFCFHSRGCSCGVQVVLGWKGTGSIFNSCAVSSTTVWLLEKDRNVGGYLCMYQFLF